MTFDVNMPTSSEVNEVRENFPWLIPAVDPKFKVNPDCEIEWEFYFWACECGDDPDSVCDTWFV